MSEGVLVGVKFIAALAVLPEVERERALSLVRVAFPEDAGERTKRLDRDRKRKSRDTNRTETGQTADESVTDSGQCPSFVPFEGVGGVSLSSDSPSSISEASLGDNGTYTPRATVPGADTVFAQSLLSFEAGVSRGKGMRYGVPRAQWDDLRDVIRVHGGDVDGPFVGRTLQEWLEFDGAAFARWVQELSPKDREAAKWNHNPRAFGRWLNDNAERVAAKPSGVIPIAGPRRVQDGPAGAGAVFGGFAAKGGS